MQGRFCVVALAANLVAASSALALDPELPPYQAVTGLSGHIRSVGSDTLNNEMALWAKGFKDLYPDVRIDVEGKGSATAPLAGASQFGPMSRPMSAEEVDTFEKKLGYRAASIRVAVDALAVYVNKENPVRCLTLQQLNRVFSSTRKIAGGGDIRTWGDAGLTGEWATRPIALYGRNSLSGTYEFFRDMALNGGDYKTALKEQPGSEAVVQAVANDRSRSVTPALATRPLACAPCLWPPIPAGPATTPRLGQPIPATTRSRVISTFI
jgi:phosphate transport system substrate-binding protein